MKLRNKKTGEIVIFGKGIVDLNRIGCKNVGEMIEAGWEDYEEPKEVWYIDFQGVVRSASKEENNWFKENEIGNYFETKEEAEKAVEKLKAWKRLKDKGFKVIEWAAGLGDDNYKIGEVMVGFDIDGVYDGNVPDDTEKDLDLLFGGEE